MMNTGRSGGRDGFLKRHHVAFAVPYHVVALPLVAITMASPQFRTGPCNPGLDILTYFVDGVTTLVMVGISTIRLIFKGRPYLLAFAVNLIAFVLLMLLGLIHH